MVILLESLSGGDLRFTATVSYFEPGSVTVATIGVRYKLLNSSTWTYVVVDDTPPTVEVTYPVTVLSLEYGRFYNVQGYITDSNGAYQFSDVQTVCTDSIPVLTTILPTYVDATTALSGGAFQDYDTTDAVTACGVCIAQYKTPTTSDTKFVCATHDGSSAPFDVQMTDLTAGVVYSMRAYATNSTGTGYGAVVKFMLLGGQLILVGAGSPRRKIYRRNDRKTNG